MRTRTFISTLQDVVNVNLVKCVDITHKLLGTKLLNSAVVTNFVTAVLSVGTGSSLCATIFKVETITDMTLTNQAQALLLRVLLRVLLILAARSQAVVKRYRVVVHLGNIVVPVPVLVVLILVSQTRVGP